MKTILLHFTIFNQSGYDLVRLLQDFTFHLPNSMLHEPNQNNKLRKRFSLRQQQLAGIHREQNPQRISKLTYNLGRSRPHRAATLVHHHSSTLASQLKWPQPASCPFLVFETSTTLGTHPALNTGATTTIETICGPGILESPLLCNHTEFQSSSNINFIITVGDTLKMLERKEKGLAA